MWSGDPFSNNGEPGRFHNRRANLAVAAGPPTSCIVQGPRIPRMTFATEIADTGASPGVWAPHSWTVNISWRQEVDGSRIEASKIAGHSTVRMTGKYTKIHSPAGRTHPPDSSTTIHAGRKAGSGRAITESAVLNAIGCVSSEPWQCPACVMSLPERSPLPS
jgi:hypothetical protein